MLVLLFWFFIKEINQPTQGTVCQASGAAFPDEKQPTLLQHGIEQVSREL